MPGVASQTTIQISIARLVVPWFESYTREEGNGNHPIKSAFLEKNSEHYLCFLLRSKSSMEGSNVIACLTTVRIDK